MPVARIPKLLTFCSYISLVFHPFKAFAADMAECSNIKYKNAVVEMLQSQEMPVQYIERFFEHNEIAAGDEPVSSVCNCLCKGRFMHCYSVDPANQNEFHLDHICYNFCRCPGKSNGDTDDSESYRKNMLNAWQEGYIKGHNIGYSKGSGEKTRNGYTMNGLNGYQITNGRSYRGRLSVNSPYFQVGYQAGFRAGLTEGYRSKAAHLNGNSLDTSQKQCGIKSCQSNTDCQSLSQAPGCDGVICRGLKQAPGLFISICALAAVKTISGSAEPRLNLGGRSIIVDSNDNVCPCNKTYVSAQCCLSDSGLVWEDPEANLGTLI